MNFEKRNNAYKIIMLIILTMFITFIVTVVGMYKYITEISYNKENIASALEEYSSTIPTNKKFETKLNIIKRYLDEYYLGEIKEEDLYEAAIKGYVNGLGDVYTEYLTEDEYNDFMISVNGDYVGVGIYMAQDIYGNIIVLAPIEESPAAEAGIETGDIIVSVNGEECINQDISIIANKIKGEEGTEVNLEILRGTEKFSKIITRRTVQIKYVSSKVLEDKIGYIKVLTFDSGCAEEFKNHLNELTNKGITSLMIDIRDNGGGIVDEVIDIAELFVKENDTIMITRDKANNKEIKVSENKETADFKLVLLVNENSASASEILAGALQDNKVATIIGTKTYGKGVMQELIGGTLGGGALKMTIEEFLTPNENKINEVGITPDIIIENEEENDKDLQLEKAVETIKNN